MPRCRRRIDSSGIARSASLLSAFSSSPFSAFVVDVPRVVRDFFREEKGIAKKPKFFDRGHGLAHGQLITAGS